LNVYDLAEVNPAIPVKELPSPEKDVAVIIPVVFIDPVEPIPTEVSPEPSPENEVAVTTPVMLMPPAPVILYPTGTSAPNVN